MCYSLLPKIWSAGILCWTSCLSLFLWRARLLFIADFHFRFFQWILMDIFIIIILAFILPLLLFRDRWGNSAWKGPQEVSRLTFCSRQGEVWDQTILLKALSSWAFKTSEGRDRTTSVGNLCHCQTLLAVQGSPRTQPEPPAAVYACCPLSSHWALLCKAQFCVLDNLPTDSRGCCYVPLKSSLLQAGQALFLSLSSQGECSRPDRPAELTPVCRERVEYNNCFSVRINVVSLLRDAVVISYAWLAR